MYKLIRNQKHEQVSNTLLPNKPFENQNMGEPRKSAKQKYGISLPTFEINPLGNQIKKRKRERENGKKKEVLLIFSNLNKEGEKSLLKPFVLLFKTKFFFFFFGKKPQ